MNRRTAGLIVLVIICASVAAFFAVSSLGTTQAKHAPQALDFTVSGTNNCLRFLEGNVSLCYVPFTVGANQNWQLTINCTQMPGGSSGWTDLYIYKGYWDNGTDCKCTAAETYPILTDIQSTGKEIQGNTATTEIFNGKATAQSYTVFFVFPNGGQGTFHVTYKQV
jgi:hypothetical protein